MKKRKLVCTRCKTRRRPAVVAPLGGGTLVLCGPCRDELREDAVETALALGVKLELEDA
jgi:hypothetical protein